MINRELIRIKTVQLLYSYLLVENPFSLESQPSAPTKEKRFAYSLYLDLLFMLTRMAREVDPKNGSPLADTRFIRNILADEKIQSLKVKTTPSEYPFAGLEKDIAAKVKESGLYRRFLQSIDEGNGDENIWKEIFELIVMQDVALNKEISERENYTLKGVDRMLRMMETTFSNFFAAVDNIQDAVKVLSHSMEKTREFYFRLLALPIAITDLREREIDNAQHKLLKTREDINPNLRLVDNEFVKFLRSNQEVQEGISKYKIDWLAENESLVRSLLKRIISSNFYKEYVEFPVTDFQTDCQLWRNLYRYLIFLDETFLEEIENKSVFWNDDLDVIGTFILKSIKKLYLNQEEISGDEGFVVPMFKDEEDAEFGAHLFREVIKKKDYYRGLILETLDKSQWEFERVAFMDAVIIMTALAEIITCPKVPLTVSFNEYIEIAKYYSTPKSGVFINGLLGQIVTELQEKKQIYKVYTNKDKKK